MNGKFFGMLTGRANTHMEAIIVYVLYDIICLMILYLMLPAAFGVIIWLIKAIAKLVRHIRSAKANPE